ncbi:Cytochrome P450 6k1 [Blattella germanica]|nr:Cytochrome P450 6k1 [Blattella germanica]
MVWNQSHQHHDFSSIHTGEIQHQPKMGLLFDSFFMELLVVAGAFFAWLYYYFTANFNHWKEKGVPYLKPVPFFGNLMDIGLHRKTQAEGFRDIYKKLEGQMFGGLFQTRIPMIMFRDPELIKHVLIKDFSYFHDRGMPHDVENDPISANLVILEGKAWKNLRLTLNPAFNSSKMRILYHLVKECADDLCRYLDPYAQKGDMVDLRDILARYATDNISSCAFGVKSNSLRNPHSKFREMGEKIIAPGSWTNMHRLFRYTVPGLLKYFNIKSFSDEITDFFVNVVKETLDYREKNNIERKDFLNLLIQLKKKIDINQFNEIEDRFFQEELENLEYEDDEQESKILLENKTSINGLKSKENGLSTNSNGAAPVENGNGKVSSRKKWLDTVETLRMYPSLPNLIRVCTKPYKIPGTNVVLEKGTPVIIPIYAIHRDPLYFSDPDRFDPERFTEYNKEKRPQYTYMPFGEGPRICIGLRFGLMQVKLGLAVLVSRYQFDLCEKSQVPLVMDPKKFVMNTVGGLWLNMTPRKVK